MYFVLSFILAQSEWMGSPWVGGFIFYGLWIYGSGFYDSEWIVVWLSGEVGIIKSFRLYKVYERCRNQR